MLVFHSRHHHFPVGHFSDGMIAVGCFHFWVPRSLCRSCLSVSTCEFRKVCQWFQSRIPWFTCFSGFIGTKMLGAQKCWELKNVGNTKMLGAQKCRELKNVGSSKVLGAQKCWELKMLGASKCWFGWFPRTNNLQSINMLECHAWMLARHLCYSK